MIELLQSWPLWLVLMIATFGLHEAWALATGRQALTDWVRTVTLRFPIMIFLLGALVGWLAGHFWGTPPPVKYGGSLGPPAPMMGMLR
jgi:hypothetical protein